MRVKQKTTKTANTNTIVINNVNTIEMPKPKPRRRQKKPPTPAQPAEPARAFRAPLNRPMEYANPPVFNTTYMPHVKESLARRVPIYEDDTPTQEEVRRAREERFQTTQVDNDVLDPTPNDAQPGPAPVDMPQPDPAPVDMPQPDLVPVIKPDSVDMPAPQPEDLAPPPVRAPAYFREEAPEPEPEPEKKVQPPRMPLFNPADLLGKKLKPAGERKEEAKTEEENKAKKDDAKRPLSFTPDMLIGLKSGLKAPPKKKVEEEENPPIDPDNIDPKKFKAVDVLGALKSKLKPTQRKPKPEFEPMANNSSYLQEMNKKRERLTPIAEVYNEPEVPLEFLNATMQGEAIADIKGEYDETIQVQAIKKEKNGVEREYIFNETTGNEILLWKTTSKGEDGGTYSDNALKYRSNYLEKQKKLLIFPKK